MVIQLFHLTCFDFILEGRWYRLRSWDLDDFYYLIFLLCISGMMIYLFKNFKLLKNKAQRNPS